MINVDKLLGQILGSSQGKALAGGLLVGGLAGALTGKTGQKLASTALKLGGAAAVAGLAYKAYQTYQQNQQPHRGGHAPSRIPSTPPPRSIEQRANDVTDILPPAGTSYLPPPADAAATEALSLKLIRAMIAAAHADGRIDRAESARIMGQVDALGIDAEERAFLLSEIGHPQSIDEIARSAANHAEAEEIYAISAMAVDAGGRAERAYLDDLSRRLNLEPGWAAAIHDRVATSAV